MKKDNNLNISTLEEKEFNRNKWFFSIGGIGRDMVYGLVANYFFMYVQFGLTLSVAQFATLSILIATSLGTVHAENKITDIKIRNSFFMSCLYCGFCMFLKNP